MVTNDTIQSDTLILKELVYDKCGFELTDFVQNLESKNYFACSYELNGMKIQQRVSKITPTKIGQFVSIWKRNKNGITEPFSVLDEIDFIIILSKKGTNFGQFIFPKSVLVEKGIITANNKVGKRAIRVYTPWDYPTNKQAIKIANWQSNYFFTIKSTNSMELDLIKKLLTK